ncbi:MAG TPA: TIGR02453 family protein, partial [Gemmatimonadales bacterium]|nr:TIGR02453 family protein [Gemmatimonadales bacterium]
MPWIVYMLRCRDRSLYTGATNDLGRRLELHRNGRGAAYTRGRAPLEVVYQETVAGRSAALRREWSLKQLSRVEKEQLIMGRGNIPTQSEFRGFGPSLMGFFGRLKRNNNREWFLANRPVYELHVKAPLQALIEEMDVRFARLAPEFVGDPRLSMFRIYRDVRFSRDKSPYKTHAACWFFHRDAGKGVGSEAHGGAGFYLHLAPEGSFLGAGIWMPPRPALQKLRDAISNDQRGFERTMLAPTMKRRF